MSDESTATLLVIGALHIDEIATATTPLVLGESNPVSWSQSIGGVAANVAIAAANGGNFEVKLLANLGDNKDSADLSSTLADQDVQVLPIWIPGTGSGRYSAIMRNTGELLVGLADVDQA